MTDEVGKDGVEMSDKPVSPIRHRERINIRSSRQVRHQPNRYQPLNQLTRRITAHYTVAIHNKGSWHALHYALECGHRLATRCVVTYSVFAIDRNG